MKPILELPPQLESDPAAAAEYAQRVLADAIVGDPKPKNGEELVAYWESQGLIGTRTDIIDPAAHSRELRQRVEKRPG